MIPKSFQEWKTCIEVHCGIRLTPDFVQGRLAVYTDPTNDETERFLTLYGEDHLNNIIQWYDQVLK